MKPTFASCLLAIILTSFVATAQVPTGTPPFGSFGGGPFDVVNLGSLNDHFTIPVMQKAGRGAPFTYNISYDTSVWYPVGSSGSQVWTAVPQYGFVLPLPSGSLTFQTVSTFQQPCNPPNDMHLITLSVYAFFVYHAADGTSHPFNDGYETYVSGCNSGNPNPSTVVASDGSGYTLSVGGNPFVSTVASKEGTLYNFVTPTLPVTDANGNQVSESSTGVITDTLGQTVLSITGTNPVKLTYTAPNGSPASYTLNYTSYNIKTNFGCSGITEYSASSVPLISSIDLPDGTSYGFTYESTPGYSGYTTARLTEVTLPTGGSLTYAYTGAHDGIVCADGSTLGLTRTLSPGGEWQYTRSQVSGAHWQTTVTSPPDPVNSGSASDVTVIDFQQDGNTTAPTYNFYETQRKVYQGPTTGTLLSTNTTCYNAHFASCVTTGVVTPITQRDVYTQVPGAPNGGIRLSELVYSQYAPVTTDKEYTYGVTLGSAPSATYLVRETDTAYTIKTNTYAGVLVELGGITVSDWSSGTQKVLSSTSYGYDLTAVTPTTNTPQHIVTGGSLGNVTNVSSVVNGSTTLYRVFTYYDTGNIKTATDWGTASTGGTNITTYNYNNTGTPSPSCGNSFPTSISEPLSLSRSLTWNCVGGVMLTATDENGKTVTSDYTTDADFWRPDFVLDQLQNKTTMTYSGQTAVEADLSFNGVNSVSGARATVDGLGRPILNQRPQTPSLAEYDTSETDYNVMGQPSRSTMPFQAAAGVTSSSAPGTTVVYDALGRPKTVTDGGGGTVSYSYTGNDVLQTVGPNQNFQKQFEYDGLGRLTSVCEVTAGTSAWPGGTCAQTNPLTGYWTKYTYDALGNLLTVTQNAQSSGNTQTRKYAYDELSRVISETNPETGNSSSGSDIAYTYDAVCGSYAASAGDLAKRVDKAGNTTCYGYDALHRLKDAGNAGTCRHYRYDTQTPPSGVTVTNTLGRQAEAYTDNCSGTKITDEWFGYDADGHLTDLYESTPHSAGYYHTSASYWANGAIDSLSALTASQTAIFPTIYYGTSTGAGLDGEGRVTKVYAASGTNPVTSAAYVSSGTAQPVGALSSVTLGSTDSDSFRYDPSTGRMTQYVFTVGSNPKTETGSLAWNANGTLNLLATVDPMNSADTQTCNYGYDGLVRVSSVACGGETNLLNPGFESGSVDWSLGAGFTIVNNSSNAQAGSWYLSGSTTTLDDETSAMDGSGNVWGAVTPGSVLYYGGWISRIGGTGNIWYSCEVVDTNHNLVAWCPWAGLADGMGGAGWNFYENSFTVPTNGAYVRFYAEIHGGNDADTSLTTAYFDTATITSTSATWQQTFSYDPFGNISKSGTSSFQPTYATATNQFTISGGNVHYDANGNQLTDNLGTTYSWSPLGNLASINSTNLIYDALGQIVEQQNGSVYTQMLYSPVGKTAIMNAQTLTEAFVVLPGGETAIYNSSSGSPAYYRHADWLGSSRLTTTASRTVYSDSAYAPFGELYALSGTADASFTGQNADTTSTLYDFTFREHSPTQGRWISPDPAGLSAVSITNPQSWNRYAYVMNNPLALIDPMGLEDCASNPYQGMCNGPGGGGAPPPLSGGGSGGYPGIFGGGEWGSVCPPMELDIWLACLWWSPDLSFINPFSPGFGGGGAGPAANTITPAKNPCAGLNGSQLVYTPAVTQHIIDSHINGNPANSSQYLFNDPVSASMKFAAVQAYNSFTFNTGGFVQRPSGLIVATTFVPPYLAFPLGGGQAVFADPFVGVDKNSGGDTNFNTLVLQKNCQNVVTSHPGLPGGPQNP